MSFRLKESVIYRLAAIIFCEIVGIENVEGKAAAVVVLLLHNVAGVEGYVSVSDISHMKLVKARELNRALYTPP